MKARHYWPEECPLNLWIYAAEWLSDIRGKRISGAYHLKDYGIDYIVVRDQYYVTHKLDACMIQTPRHKQKIRGDLTDLALEEGANVMIRLGIHQVRHELQDPAVQWAKLQRAIFVEVYNQGKPEHLRLKE